MTGRFSIVVPSYNRPDLLRCCLKSILRHSPPGTQWLVVDDASAGACVSGVAGEFPGVEVIRRTSQGGFCKAVNTGLQAAEGEIIQVLNDDAEVEPGFAEAALRRFRDPRIVAVTPLVLTGDRVDSTGDVYIPAGIARKRGHGQPLQPHHLRAGRVFGASGSASFYRRETLLACGGFAEDLGAYFDDVDLSFRLNRRGEVWFEPASRVHHRVSASYGRPSGDLLTRQSRNEELVFWRNLPPLQLLLWLPAHLTALGLKALRRWRAGELAPFLRGRWQALTSVHEILRYRARWLAPAPGADYNS